MEEGSDIDVSPRSYPHYLLISFISITASLLLADGCHLDGNHGSSVSRGDTHAPLAFHQIRSDRPALL